MRGPSSAPTAYGLIPTVGQRAAGQPDRQPAPSASSRHQQPLFLDPDAVRRVGFTVLREHLAPQYARLSVADRRLWLTNLSFLLTPTCGPSSRKWTPFGATAALAQARCFLLGGVSGMGKSSFFNWYAGHSLPTVQGTRNHVPVVKIDALVSNRTPKPLFQRMLLACGAALARG